MNIAVATYPRLYVRPVEKHELESVTSTFTMSCNVLLQDCTRHTRTLPHLTNVEAAARQTSLVLGSFTEATIIGTQECALGERA
jgi:hypothetical protein